MVTYGLKFLTLHKNSEIVNFFLFEITKFIGSKENCLIPLLLCI